MGDNTREHAGCLLILASASPRRRELMQRLGRPFVSETSSAKEIVPAGISVPKTAEYLSGLKAGDIFQRHTEKDLVVIGSDTIVVCEGKIFGKPVNEEEAFRMLRFLSGRSHEVLTGVTILWRKPDGTEGQTSFTSETKVIFYELSDEEIRAYISTGEPMDKAGAYGIQDDGALLIRGIEGDYYTVVGFPIGEINRRLREYEL